MSEQRFPSTFRSAATGEPGLVLHEDGTVWLVAADGSETQLSAGTNALSRFGILFTETEGDGTYTGGIDLPPGTSILDVAVFCLAGPWNAAAASLVVGDIAHPDDGYIQSAQADLVNVLKVPYDSLDGHTNIDTSWVDPSVSAGVYGGAANWYTAGNSVYTPTVRYPNGERITATVIASGYGGPVAEPGIVVVDVIGFGVPGGSMHAVKT